MLEIIQYQMDQQALMIKLMLELTRKMQPKRIDSGVEPVVTKTPAGEQKGIK